MANRIDIRDGGRLLYDPDFLPQYEADALFAWLLSSIPWRQESVRGRPLPRMNAWYADAGLTYSYSGVSHEGSGWAPELHVIPHRVADASGASFNSLLLNL
jgi:hypothetical protein